MSEAIFPLDKLILGACAIMANLESKLWGTELEKIGERFLNASPKEKYWIKKIAMFALLYITTRSFITSLLLTLIIVLLNFIL